MGLFLLALNMAKFKRVVLLFIVGLILSSCGLDNKSYSDVSSNINESVKRKVFLKEYKVDSLKLFDPSKKLAIESVWLEKSWGINYDSIGKEVFYINSKLSNVIFKINPNSIFKENDYSKKWIIEDNNNDPGGLIGSSDRTKIFVMVDNEPKPSDKWVVYELKEPYIYNRNTVKIAEFNLTKK